MVPPEASDHLDRGVKVYRYRPRLDAGGSWLVGRGRTRETAGRPRGVRVEVLSLII